MGKLSNLPIEDQIFDKIKGSGYIMEQEVADYFESMGFNVITNFAYEDIDTNTSREIDIVATKRVKVFKEFNACINISFICECKKTSGVLTFLGNLKKQADKEITFSDYLLPCMATVMQGPNNSWIQEGKDIFQYLNINKKHYYYNQMYKTSQFVGLSLNGDKVELNQDSKGETVFHKYVIPPIKALLDIKRKNFPNDNEYKEIIQLYFPIVVVNGDIYYIDYTAKDAKEILKVQYISLIHNYAIKSENKNIRVDFVKKEELPEFLNNNVLPYVEYISSLIDKNPYCFIRQKVHKHDFEDLYNQINKY